MTPLKTHWMEIFKPITENLKLDMRMNLKTKKVLVMPGPCGVFIHSASLGSVYTRCCI